MDKSEKMMYNISVSDKFIKWRLLKNEKIKGGDLQGLRTFFTTQVMMQHEIQHKTEKPLKNQGF